jgi:hypothetical protein
LQLINHRTLPMSCCSLTNNCMMTSGLCADRHEMSEIQANLNLGLQL